MAKRSSKTPIDEIAEEAIRRIREAQKETSMHAIEDRPGRRGPMPGSGGRPPKARVRRVARGVSLMPEVWQQLEAERQPGESLSDTLERVLLARKQN